MATITTDDHGKASLNLLPNRRYYALERKAPDGFILNPERIPFTTGNSGGSVSTKDKPGRFTLTISQEGRGDRWGTPARRHARRRGVPRDLAFHPWLDT